MQVHSELRPISLHAPTMIFIGVFIVLVLPLVLGFAFFDTLYAFYLSRFVAPELEESLGFLGRCLS